MNENPLSQYFRTAAIHLTLPSNGEFYGPGALEMPVTDEVPVLPMTAIDEITYKTPDALFNGSAIVSVIQSCVPAIKDAWHMPVTDLTAVLIAIRIASFGHNMEIETICPSCGAASDYVVDLRDVLESITVTDYSKPLPIGDLSILFKPMNYLDLNANNKLQFEENRLNYLLSTAEMDEAEQLKLLSESFKKVSDYTLLTLAKNILSISTPDSVVTEEDYILEFLQKCESTEYKKIKDAVITMKVAETMEPLHIKCQALIDKPSDTDPNETEEPEVEQIECGQEYDQPFTLDMTSFFDRK